VSQFAPDLEIEAKFRVSDPLIIERLIGDPEVGGLPATGDGRMSEYIDRYLDTPDDLLRRTGWTLRIRRIPGSVLGSLKSIVPPTQGSLHVRTEIEAPADENPDPRSWPDSNVRSRALELLGTATPAVVAAVRQHRIVRALTDEHGLRIELSIDDVKIDVGELQAARWFEIEIELAAGSPRQLELLATRLIAEYDLRPEHRSKGDRALAIARGEGIAA
jgi:inorganic triphosphatase YgiF